jgi:hypothetical protein
MLTPLTHDVATTDFVPRPRMTSGDLFDSQRAACACIGTEVCAELGNANNGDVYLVYSCNVISQKLTDKLFFLGHKPTICSDA